ncbi:MAG: shikimate dehydrogenase, partial [Vicinamibacteria bacterium]
SRPRVLLGLIGAGIQQTLSPALHEGEGDAQGLRLQYRIYDLDVLGLGERALPSLLDAARLLGYAGMNITFPCKQTVLPLLDALSDDARAMNAVNTVVFRDGRATGHNTDASGFAHGFQRGLPYASTACVALIGAGGAGSAVAHAMLGLGTRELRIVDNDPARSDELARGAAARFPDRTIVAVQGAREALAGASGVINATPIGMAKLPGTPIDAALLDAKQWVADCVYRPIDTALLTAARSRGCATLDGGGMNVGHAVDAFRLFTGLDADPARVARHFAALIAAERAAGS